MSSNHFNPTPVLYLEPELWGKTVGLATASFRLWGAVLERGTPSLPFPCGDGGTSAHPQGQQPGPRHRVHQPCSFSAAKESEVKYWLLCQKSANMPGCSRTVLPNTLIWSPQDMEDRERPRSYTCLQDTQTFWGLRKIPKDISNSTG